MLKRITVQDFFGITNHWAIFKEGNNHRARSNSTSFYKSIRFLKESLMGEDIGYYPDYVDVDRVHKFSLDFTHGGYSFKYVLHTTKSKVMYEKLEYQKDSEERVIFTRNLSVCKWMINENSEKFNKRLSLLNFDNNKLVLSSLNEAYYFNAMEYEPLNKAFEFFEKMEVCISKWDRKLKEDILENIETDYKKFLFRKLKEIEPDLIGIEVDGYGSKQIYFRFINRIHKHTSDYLSSTGNEFFNISYLIYRYLNEDMIIFMDDLSKDVYKIISNDVGKRKNNQFIYALK